MTTKQFQASFYIVIGLCISTIVLSFISFDFIEIDTAVNWTMKYFALPILIVTASSCYFIYLNFIKRHEKKEYRNKIWSQTRTIFRVFSLTLGMTIIFIATSLSMIILTNAYLNDNKTINLNAKILDYYTSTGKGGTRHYIKIQDQRLDRIINLKVEHPYQVGKVFSKTMKIGRWGLLYSEK